MTKIPDNDIKPKIEPNYYFNGKKMIKESKIKIDETEINYVSFGKGEQVMVLIPGLSLREVKGSGLFIAYMYRIFSKKYKVYCFDKRTLIPANSTVENFADDLAFCMKQLNIKNADVLGISQGGMIGQYLAIKYPELVRKLCLGVTLSKNNPTVISCVNNWIKLAEVAQYEKLVTNIFYKMYSERYLNKYKFFLPILKRLGKPKRLIRFINSAKACLTCNTNELLENIKCPVLVLGGKKDNVLTGKASQEIAEKLSCEIYMYEELGHSAYEEAADFNSRVLNFFMK